MDDHFQEDELKCFFWYKQYRKGMTLEKLNKYDLVITPYGM